MEIAGTRLSTAQLRLLTVIFAQGAEDASRSLSKWLRRGVRLTVSSVDQVPLDEASAVLGPPDEMITACLMGLGGRLCGHLVLAFDDDSGLGLVDLLTGRPLGTTSEWGELERSAAMETANIVGCAYVNSLKTHLPGTGAQAELIPSPPIFWQDFAASLMQSTLTEQAMYADQVLLVRTHFARDGTEMAWHFLFVPDHGSLVALSADLEGIATENSA